MSKKGIQVGMTVVVSAIAILIGAVVLFGFTGMISKSLEKDKDRTICRSSVITDSLTMRIDSDLVDLDCKTYNVEFFENKVEIGGKEIELVDPKTGTKTRKFDKLTEETVNRVVAEELRKCWWQFLEGKSSIWSAQFLGSFGMANCYVCDEIYFDKSVSRSGFYNFYQYLNETTMPNSEKTYYQYLAEEPRITAKLMYDKDPNLNAWEEYLKGSTWGITLSKCGIRGTTISRTPIQPAVTFYPNQKYVVYFAREGGIAKHDINTPADECNSENYFAYVLPVEDLPKQCDTVRRGK